MKRHAIPALLAWSLVAPVARADAPVAEAAARAWAIADAVIARHVEPPDRPKMLEAGARAMALAARGVVPDDLGRRVAGLSGPDQLAALLGEILDRPRVEGGPARPRLLPSADDRTPETVFLEGLGSAVPGGVELLSEKERKVRESFEANLYVGVQVKLGFDEEAKRPVFLAILEGGPAEAAGARDGDLIEEVDGESTAGMPLAGVVDRLRGVEGTDVLVRFRRPSTDEVFNRPMTRATLPRATVAGPTPSAGKPESIRLDGPDPIGYLRLTEVAGSTPQELRAFAARLESGGVKALVLDLRQATPARFHPTVLLADALLDGGVIGRVRRRDGEATYRAGPDALFRGWPMVVLADPKTEPEIAWLCEALRDNRRATILGHPTPDRAPFVLEAVPLPGGQWSALIAIGRLGRGDGRPLPDPSGDSPAPASRPRISEAGPMGEARAILEAALKSASK